VMISYSEMRQFLRCQRQWFFKNVLAHWKDPVRREALILSKLQSLSAWRGSIVDAVLSSFVLPRLRQRDPPSFTEAIQRARTLFEKQSRFALAHRVREAGIKISACGEDFAAWHDIEYGSPPSAEALEGAWNDIETALRHAFGMTELFSDLSSRELIVQPRLIHAVHSVSVNANPDLVGFAASGSIRVVDWKVHSFGLRAAKQQLLVYAGVLRRGKPHRHWPVDPRTIPLDQLSLTEVQLLNNQVHDYAVTEDEIDEVFDELFEIAELMRLARGADRDDDRRVEEFPATPWIEICDRCSFKKICREGVA